MPTNGIVLKMKYAFRAVCVLFVYYVDHRETQNRWSISEEIVSACSFKTCHFFINEQ